MTRFGQAILRFLRQISLPNLAVLATAVSVLVGIWGMVWPSYQYYRETEILPKRIPPNLSLTARLENLGLDTDGTVLVLRSTITAKNISKQRALVLAGWYNVYAYNVSLESDDAVAGALYQEAVTPLYNSSLPMPALGDQKFDPISPSRHVNESAATLINSGAFVPLRASVYLEPDEELPSSHLLYVPNGKYDSLKLLAQALFLKRDAPTFTLHKGMAPFLSRDDPPQIERFDGSALTSTFYFDAVNGLVGEVALVPSGSEAVEPLRSLGESVEPWQFDRLKTMLADDNGLAWSESSWWMTLWKLEGPSAKDS